jgi:hypothetical protein
LEENLENKVTYKWKKGKNLNGYWDAWRGRCIWINEKRRLHITYDDVVILLSEDDGEWNRQALLLLPHYMKRKGARRAIIFASENISMEFVKRNTSGVNIVLEEVNLEKQHLLNRYYCLRRFFDNIVFFFLDYPKDNNAREIIENDNISKRELIALAFYVLRCVPEEVTHV